MVDPGDKIIVKTAKTEEETRNQLKQIVDRIETLNEEKSSVMDAIKDIYDEASDAGFDKKILRQLIKIRKKSEEEIEIETQLLQTYKKALE